MKKLIFILLCLCLVLIPLNVMALDSAEAEAIVADDTVISETPIDDGGITITHAPAVLRHSQLKEFLPIKEQMGKMLQHSLSHRHRGL